MFLSFLKSLYRKITPPDIRKKIWQSTHNRRIYKHNSNFIQYIEKNVCNLTDDDNALFLLIKKNLYIDTIECRSLISKWKLIRNLEKECRKDEEKLKILNFLKRNHAIMLPYDFVNKYKEEDIKVLQEGGHKYVIHENKRMYFPEKWEDERIQEYYNSLVREQDIESPHRYEYNNIQINQGDIVVDIGTAEGFFALSVIEKAEKVYLFECDELWHDALKMTFLPYREKTVIINKYVGEYSSDYIVTIDQIFDGKEINFIKADVEGAELKILKGASKFLSDSKNIKLVFCTYHNKNDALDIKKILLKYNFHVEFSKGYILLRNENYSLRKGVIRGYK